MLTVNCPACRKAVEWSEAFPERPFCSTRCRQHDFLGWVNEEHRVAGDPEDADLFDDPEDPRAPSSRDFDA